MLSSQFARGEVGMMFYFGNECIFKGGQSDRSCLVKCSSIPSES